jgi:hypothetical protein
VNRIPAMSETNPSGHAPQMHYRVSESGLLTYLCWVAYRPIDQIENVQAYMRQHTRAGFVYEAEAKWFCQQFNDAVAQKVEPFQ